MNGKLSKNLTCWHKTTPYNLQKGVAIMATFDSALDWWIVILDTPNGPLTLTTTDNPFSK